MKNIIKYLAFFVVCYFALAHVANKTEGQPLRTALEDGVNVILEKAEPRDKNTPCQNLDVLDDLKEVMHWEIIDDTLRIYTLQDSIRDEIERWNYIRSLEDDDVWE